MGNRWTSEQAAREEILTMVKHYCEEYHKPPAYNPGDRIPYAGRVYDFEEMTALVDSALDFWLTAGRYTERFEKEFAEFLGIKYCALVNSGSSANLLAFMALTSPLLGERKIERGDEVITVAAAFPTTVAPIVQFGAIPVFVDITIPQYNIDVTQLEDAVSKKTKAVMLAHTLGNPFNIKAVKEFCEEYNLWLIEDNCDALGSRYKLNGEWKYTGTFGDIGTSSFYPPHHMTMGEGGAVYTDNPLLYKIILSLRDWGRDCICPPGRDGVCGHRFDRKHGDLPLGYDHKYVYSHFGYNLKATDMQAAIGCAQLLKQSEFKAKRTTNFYTLQSIFNKYEDLFLLPDFTSDSEPNWFGFLVTCKKSVKRNELVSYLEAKDIQTRMLFAGNLLKHPCVMPQMILEKDYRVINELTNTESVMNDTFWIGVYPGINQQMTCGIGDILDKFCSR